MDRPTALSVFGRNPSFIGGMELFARELSRQLASRGWRSVLAYLHPPSESVTTLLDLPNVELVVLEDPFSSSLTAMRSSLSLLRRHRPSVVHMHFTPIGSPLPRIARLACGARSVHTDHSSRPASYAMGPDTPHKRLLLRAVGAQWAAVICPSRFGLDCLRARRILPDRKLHQIYNAVDVVRAERGEARGEEVRRRFGIPDGRTVVAQTSWMIPEKGWPDLLTAARIVVNCDPNVHFLMVGDGAHSADYERMASDLGIASHLTWAGTVDDPLGSGVCAAADIWCQVSRWQELFGFTIAEAMAAGRPVIGTRTGGIPEVIDGGTTGYLVEPGDAEAIAARILELARDTDLRDRMGRAGQAAVAKRFSLGKNVAQLLEVYGIGPTCAVASAHVTEHATRGAARSGVGGHGGPPTE